MALDNRKVKGPPSRDAFSKHDKSSAANAALHHILCKGPRHAKSALRCGLGSKSAYKGNVAWA